MALWRSRRFHTRYPSGLFQILDTLFIALGTSAYETSFSNSCKVFSNEWRTYRFFFFAERNKGRRMVETKSRNLRLAASASFRFSCVGVMKGLECLHALWDQGPGYRGLKATHPRRFHLHPCEFSLHIGKITPSFFQDKADPEILF